MVTRDGAEVPFQLDDMEFGRRCAVDRELAKTGQGSTCNLVFDESSTFILYASVFGIKIVNCGTKQLVPPWHTFY